MTTTNLKMARRCVITKEVSIRTSPPPNTARPNSLLNISVTYWYPIISEQVPPGVDIQQMVEDFFLGTYNNVVNIPVTEAAQKLHDWVTSYFVLLDDMIFLDAITVHSENSKTHVSIQSIYDMETV